MQLAVNLCRYSFVLMGCYSIPPITAVQWKLFCGYQFACAGAGVEKRRAHVAQLIASRAGRNFEEDDGAFMEVLVAVSALYQAAYSIPRPGARPSGNVRQVTEQELLMRMALPWLLAPRHLAALIAHGKDASQSSSNEQ